MKTYLVSFRWLAVALLGVALVALSGCAQDNERETKQERRARSGQVATLGARLNRLEERLNQLDRELAIQRDLQRNQIAAAKEDLDAIRDTLSAYNKALGRAPRTTETVVIVEPLGEAEAQADEQPRQRAENRVLSTLLLLAFLGFVGIFAAKLWKEKNGEERSESDSGSEDNSFVFYSKESQAKGEEKSPEAEEPKPADEERPPSA